MSSNTIKAVPSSPTYDKGRMFLTLPFDLDGKSIKIRLYDNRAKAKQSCSTINLAGTVLTKEDAVEMLEGFLAQDVLSPDEEVIVESIQKALGKHAHHWSMWTESKYLPEGMALVAWLRPHNFEDFEGGLKGELLLCKTKQGVGKDNKPVTIADTLSTVKKWRVAVKEYVNNRYPILDITTVELKEKEE